MGWSHAKENQLADFDFNISFDPELIAAGRVIELDKSFELNGQRLTLVRAELYPTHSRFTFASDEANTMWLKGLKFTVSTEDGKFFDSALGVSSFGNSTTPETSTYMMESPYFYNCESLTVSITASQWLDKNSEIAHIDLANCTAEGLPEGTELKSCERTENGWIVAVTGAQLERGGASYQILGSEYRDANGKRYHADGFSRYSNDDGVRIDELMLDGYEQDEVWVSLNFSETSSSAASFKIFLK